jgi:hypothetical protein
LYVYTYMHLFCCVCLFLFYSTVLHNLFVFYP